MSNYYKTHNRTIQDLIRADGELSCPIAYTDIDSMDNTKISHVRLTADGKMTSMVYFEADALEQWLKQSDNDPFTNLKFKGPIKERLKIIQEARTCEAPPNPNEIFQLYCASSLVFQQEKPDMYKWLRRHINLEDNGFLCPWNEESATAYRDKALSLLDEKPKGSFVLRPSSIKSTNHFRVVALSFVLRPKTRTFYEPHDVFNAEIGHILIGHGYGYGYMIVDQTKVMPDLQNGVPMPKHDKTWGSFLDLLGWLEKGSIDLKKIVYVE